MIVYGELLFIENAIIGWVLLYLTGEICGFRSRDKVENRGVEKAGRRCTSKVRERYIRFLIGSLMCGAFSLTIFLDIGKSGTAKGLVLIVMEVFFAAAVCTVTFGCKGPGGEMKKISPKRMQWRHALTFILVTYFMGGIVMGALLVTQNQGIYTAVGIYTGDMKAAVLILFICLGYATIKQIIKTVRNKKLFTEHTYEAEIVMGKHIVKASAFLDTGNRLKEPITGKPVAVASEELWQRMMSAASKADENAADVRFAAVPYETVGTRGILEAVRTDRLEVNGRRIKGCLIARSERQLEMGRDDDSMEIGSRNMDGSPRAGYDLLISGEMIK